MIRPIPLVIMINETHTNDQTNTTGDNETHNNDQTTVSDSGSVCVLVV